MGAFKPLLPFGKGTVIECCVETLRAADIKNVVVVVGHRKQDLQAQLKPLEVNFAVNEDPDGAMSFSIERGVDAVNPNSRALLIALADHPAVPKDVITILIEEWRRGARLVQPEHEGRGGHPVLIDLVYRKELLTLDAQTGLRGLFTTHRAEVRRVPVKSPYVARDMDTWEDYRQLHKDVFGVAPPNVLV